jgi:hypothetical protein
MQSPLFVLGMQQKRELGGTGIFPISFNLCTSLPDDLSQHLQNHALDLLNLWEQALVLQTFEICFSPSKLRSKLIIFDLWLLLSPRNKVFRFDSSITFSICSYLLEVKNAFSLLLSFSEDLHFVEWDGKFSLLRFQTSSNGSLKHRLVPAAEKPLKS